MIANRGWGGGSCAQHQHVRAGLDLAGWSVPELAASTGSACHAGTTDPSPVLTAMGIDLDRALSEVRLSLGRWTTGPDIDRAAELLIVAAGRLRQDLDTGQPRSQKLTTFSAHRVQSASSSSVDRRVPLVSMSSVMPRASMHVPQQPMSAPWLAQAPIIRSRW